MRRAFLLLMLGACAHADPPAGPPPRPHEGALAVSELPGPLQPWVGCYRLEHGGWSDAGFHEPEINLPELVELTTVPSREALLPEYDAGVFVVRTTPPVTTFRRLTAWAQGRGDSIFVGRNSGISGYKLQLVPRGRDLVGRIRYVIDIGPRSDEGTAALRRVSCPEA